MAASDQFVEQTTSAAVEEKAKLQKHFSRFDIYFFLICTIVGVDTLGQVAANGAQGFLWLLFLAVFFFVPYALLTAELGAAFTEEGAVEALAGTIPLFLVLFAASYFLMVHANAASFSSHHLTRTDALYFTVTVFSTVGFGDITATSQSARALVMTQIVLDLVIFGLGIRILTQAVHVGRARQPAEKTAVTTTNSPP